MFLVFILYLFFASTFTFSKAALDYCSPSFLTATRFLVAGVLLLGYQYFFHRNEWRCDKKDYWLFFQMMFITSYLSFATDCWSLQYITSSKSCLIYNLSPFITAIISYILFKTKLTTKQSLGLLIGFLGYIPILMVSAPDEVSAGYTTLISFPEIVLIFSVACGSYGWLVLKRLVVDEGYSPIMVNGVGVFGGGIMALMQVLFLGEKIQIQSHGASQPFFLTSLVQRVVGMQYLDMGMFLIYLSLLIVTSHLICYNLYGKLLKQYSATFLAFAGFIAPLFAALLGWLFLNEQLSWQFFLTIVIVSIGLYLFYQDELRQEAIKTA